MERSETKKFLIDGFPRSQGNLDAYEELIGDKAEIQCVLNFECPTEVLLERILGRNVGRTDDNIDTFTKRIDTFRTETMPIIEHYRTLGKVINVDTNRSIEDINQTIADIFSQFE
eukprot:TRINITY_DN356_c1_g1_i3.p2 TRINITY_DN356_c1_g1~~TRINITY_DN356_c1_g1_i3.p2  ORF type:complete len:115 (+),score=22.19 TRINITY_DN356_c1_g1_i3:770-1114(+)